MLGAVLGMVVISLLGCGDDGGTTVDGECFEFASCTCGDGRMGTTLCPEGPTGRTACECEDGVSDAGSDAMDLVDPSCFENDSMSPCESAGCTWIAAGCDPPSGVVRAGACVDEVAQTCTTDTDCGDGASCDLVWINPCAGSTCEACGGDAGYCFPDSEALRVCSVMTGPCDMISPPECPERPPRIGTVCDSEGMTCHYCPGGEEPSFAGAGVDVMICTSGSWEANRLACGG